jgi:hypothetical protein
VQDLQRDAGVLDRAARRAHDGDWRGGSFQECVHFALLWALYSRADGAPVPFNLKDRDAFHFTIEEYLLAVVSLIDELVRPTPLTATLP